MQSPLRSRSLCPWIPALTLLSLGACQSRQYLAQPEPAAPTPVEVGGPWDLLHADIELSLKPLERSISGVLRYSLTPRSATPRVLELRLDGPALTAARLTSGEPLPFEVLGRTVSITLPGVAPGERVDIELEYAGHPGPGLWYEGIEDAGLFAATRTVAESASAARGAWLPTLLDENERLTANLSLELPSGWSAVAPGERVERSELDQRAVERFECTTEFPLAWLGFAAGAFDQTNLEAGPLRLYVLSQDCRPEWAEASFARAPAAVAFLERSFGITYPAGRFTVACLPEAQSQALPAGAVLPVSVIGDELARADGDAAVVLCEALARQFLGSELMPRAEHRYLEIGLARYLALRFMAEIDGVDRFDRELRRLQAAALETPQALIGFDVETHGEPALVARAVSRLHLLRCAVGEAAFRTALRDFVAANRGRRTTSADFQASLELAAKQDLRPLFEDWLERGGDPSFVLAWRYDAGSREVEIELEQTHETGDLGAPAAYRAPVEIEVSSGPRTNVERVVLEGRRQSLRLPASEKPTWVRFDRELALPKRLEPLRSGEEWLAIAARCPDAQGRAEAMAGLGELVRSTKKGALADMYRTQLIDRALRDGSANVRAAAVSELGRTESLEIQARLQQIAVRDASLEVRCMALEALGEFGPEAALASFANARFADAPSWKVKAAAAALFARSSPKEARRWLAERLVVESPQQRLRADLLTTLGTLPDREVDELLLGWAKDRQAAEGVRVAAIAAIGRRRPKDGELGAELGALLSARERPVRLALLEALARRVDERSRALIQDLDGAPVSAEEKRAIEAGLRRE
jgi:aminopeptidase N